MPDETAEEAREEEHKLPEPPDDEVAAELVARFEGSVFFRSHGQPGTYTSTGTIWSTPCTIA